MKGSDDDDIDASDDIDANDDIDAEEARASPN